MLKLLCSLFTASVLVASNGCTPVSAPPAEEKSATNVSPVGSWSIMEYVIEEAPDPGRTDDVLVIRDDGTGSLMLAGNSEEIQFVIEDSAETPGFIEYKIATKGDEISWGGAGPRTGILRILEDGTLEMLESNGAGAPYPDGFTPENKKYNIFIRLKPE